MSLPVYEYKCWSCGAFFEELQPMSAPKEGTVCPKCGSTETTRIPSNFADLGHGCADKGDYAGFS